MLFEDVKFKDANRVSKFLIKVLKSEILEGDPREILKEFSKIRAITFSTSVKGVLELLKNYSEIELLIGIEDQSIAIYKLSEFLDNLRKDLKDCVVNNQKLSVYFIPGCHSKLYLLYETEKKLAIVGSGNLSLSAWKGQQEEIFVLIEDEKGIRELENYYFSLKEKAQEIFISEKIKRIVAKRADALGIKTEIFSDDPEMIQDLMKRPEVKEVALHAYLKNMASLSVLENLDKARIEKRNQENSFAFLERIRNYKKDLLSMSMQNFQKANSILKEINKEEIKVPDVEIGEKEIFYKGKSIDLLIIENSALRKTVKALNEYIESAKETSQEYPVLIGETIVFAFYAPFLNKVRMQALKEGKDLNHFPIFALLIGEAGAGKTMLLKFIAKLLGTNLYHYRRIEKIKNTPAYTLESYAYEKEALPLLVDEVNPSHFRDTSALGEVLKHLSEDPGVRRGFLFTSNLREFRGERQIMRRACFLPFKVQVSSKKNVGLLLNEINTSLFLKFLKFMQGKEIEIKEDPFYFARDYLLNEGVLVPESYSGNFERAMLERWRELYLTSPEKFQEVKALHKKDKEKIVDCFKVKSEDIGYVTPLEIFDNGYMSGYYILLKDEFLKALQIQEKLPFWKRFFKLS